MNQPLYDVICTGQLLEGTDPELALIKLAKAFKTSTDKVAKFIEGQPHTIKRGVDKSTALQYKSSLRKIGVMVAFQLHQASSEASRSANQANESPSSTEGALTLAPVGADVLREDERRVIPENTIDTSALKLSSAFQEQTVSSDDQHPSPDVSHLSIAETGSDLNPDRPEPPEELELNLDEYTLSVLGCDMGQLKDEQPALKPDTSALSLAPAGSQLTEGKAQSTEKAPDVSHLSLSSHDTE